MPKVSIILPIYNVEPWLDRCLESIARQTHPDFEALMVDDGSPDRCGEICDRWARRDPRFIAIHQKNGGENPARNAALAVAKGDFLLCVDPDDYVKPDHIENLLRAQALRDADLTIGRPVWVNEATDRVLRTFPARGELFIERENFAAQLPALFRDGRLLYCTYRLCRRSTFGHVLFPQDIRLSGDTYWMAGVLDAAQSIQLTDDDGYIYVRYEKGCLTRQIHPNLFQYRQRVCEAMRAVLAKNGWLTPEAAAFWDEWLVISMKWPVQSVCHGPWSAREKVQHIEAMLGNPLFIEAFDRLAKPPRDRLSLLMRAGDGRALLRRQERLYLKRALVRRLPDWARRLGRAFKRSLRAVRHASRRQPRAAR